MLYNWNKWLAIWIFYYSWWCQPKPIPRRFSCSVYKLEFCEMQSPVLYGSVYILQNIFAIKTKQPSEFPLMKTTIILLPSPDKLNYGNTLNECDPNYHFKENKILC
uniref:Uncharacterized protein n=1 Tax=Sphaerodactylus townsendi TaxID=933632 RepID=A0ACB8G1F1_9SAUR